jgi:high-affinity iron transporter
MLTEKSISGGGGDNMMAFAHAYIPHSVIFPLIKNILDETNMTYAKNLESKLTDLPFLIKSGSSLENIKQDIIEVKSLLNNISNQTVDSIPQPNRKLMFSEITIALLNDADTSYKLSNDLPNTMITTTANNNKQITAKRFDQIIEYQNAIGLVSISKSNYDKVSYYPDNDRNSQIKSLFTQLENSITKKSDKESVSGLINTISKSLIEDQLVFSSSSPPPSSAKKEEVGNGSNNNNNNNNGYSRYFLTIRSLLSNVITEVKNGNYDKADQYATTAYLDNFEYLEPLIEKHDPKIKSDIEIAMREELRQMIKEKATPEKIITFINNGILSKLDKAEVFFKNDLSSSSTQPKQNQNVTIQSIEGGNSSGGGGPAAIVTSRTNGKLYTDIQALSKGFGVYGGERRNIGQADESSKSVVRSNIDQIRVKLDEMLQQYKEGNHDEALSASRSAYLDSYENIEIPLRPISPDFTLDMEIKFAQLRNLIEANAAYEKIQGKVFEIRQGLDESERLVSGTGVVAPAIAFSTSFSIIFREGLESALIIGAILAYLEASRNVRFKKHVYYGIAIAVGATAATWFIAEFMIEISGASRELIEAIAGISAVAVLFWVSFWVLNKVETKRWIEFVKAKVWRATTTGSVMVFVLLSFFTVYREGFETVLFYQAILSFAKNMEWYVIVGLLSGLAIIIGVVFLIRKLGKKLPLRVLFGLTMGVGAYMSIAFMGNAIRSFQEVGYISTTHLIGIIPRFDINIASMTGIHPTFETVVAQLILLSVYIAGSIYILIIQPRKKRAIEMSRKSMADIGKKKK